MPPKYQEIVQLVHAQVRDGEYSHRPIPSERQIAQLFGVSHMTARKATQAMLREGMLTRLENGRLAPRAQAVVKIKGPKIALVSPSFDSESIHKVHVALEEVIARRKGLLRPVGFTRFYDTIIQEVLEADYDGIFLLPPKGVMPQLFLDLLKRHASRLAVIFKDMSGHGLMSVGYCAQRDASLVWDYLYKLGHRHIAYLNTEPDADEPDQVYALFEEWCAQRGVENVIIRDPVENFGYADLKAYAVMKTALKQGRLKSTTALFASNVNLARAAIRAFHEHGIAIGPDMSVCTQDQPRIAQLSTPSITTLDLKPLNPLIEQIIDWFDAGPRKQSPPLEMLHFTDVHVLVGESTVPPRTGSRGN